MAISLCSEVTLFVASILMNLEWAGLWQNYAKPNRQASLNMVWIPKETNFSSLYEHNALSACVYILKGFLPCVFSVRVFTLLWQEVGITNWMIFRYTLFFVHPGIETVFVCLFIKLYYPCTWYKYYKTVKYLNWLKLVRHLVHSHICR